MPGNNINGDKPGPPAGGLAPVTSNVASYYRSQTCARERLVSQTLCHAIFLFLWIFVTGLIVSRLTALAGENSLIVPFPFNRLTALGLCASHRHFAAMRFVGHKAFGKSHHQSLPRLSPPGAAARAGMTLCQRSREGINHLTPRRQDLPRPTGLSSFACFATLRLGMKCFCSSRHKLTASTHWAHTASSCARRARRPAAPLASGTDTISQSKSIAYGWIVVKRILRPVAGPVSAPPAKGPSDRHRQRWLHGASRSGPRSRGRC